MQKEFTEQAASVALRAYKLNRKGRIQGLGELEDDVDAEGLERLDVFEFGLRLAAHAAEPGYAAELLSNMVDLEPDPHSRRLKAIQREAALCVLNGASSGFLFNVLFSHMEDAEREEVWAFIKGAVPAEDAEAFGTLIYAKALQGVFHYGTE